MLYYYARQPEVFQSKLRSLEKKFPSYLQKIRNLPFVLLPWKTTRDFKKIKLPKGVRGITIIGMGGSSLGIKTLLEAFPGHYHVNFIDNVEPHFVDALLYNYSDKRKNLFIFISKSGETIEVLSLANIILGKRIRPAALPPNALVITDKPNSTLGKLANKWRIPIITGDADIPGRFSALSVSTLLPFILAKPSGIVDDAASLFAGARAVSFAQAYKLACVQYLHFVSGKNIVVLFPYMETLNRFVDWYIQLLSESIGKSLKIGITPVKAMGVKDQHSQLQLFLDGPKDKFFIFLKPERWRVNTKIPGKKYGVADLFDAEYEGVKKAFLKKKLPFLELRFAELTPSVLGELLFFFELEVAFLGSFLKVNFQNQPAVELSKRYTNILLKKH